MAYLLTFLLRQKKPEVNSANTTIRGNNEYRSLFAREDAVPGATTKLVFHKGGLVSMYITPSVVKALNEHIPSLELPHDPGMQVHKGGLVHVLEHCNCSHFHTC